LVVDSEGAACRHGTVVELSDQKRQGRLVIHDLLYPFDVMISKGWLIRSVILSMNMRIKNKIVTPKLDLLVIDA
jgi:hypothetical protein